jgi:hypothetical protein
MRTTLYCAHHLVGKDANESVLYREDQCGHSARICKCCMFEATYELTGLFVDKIDANAQFRQRPLAAIQRAKYGIRTRD